MASFRSGGARGPGGRERARGWAAQAQHRTGFLPADVGRHENRGTDGTLIFRFLNDIQAFPWGLPEFSRSLDARGKTWYNFMNSGMERRIGPLRN